MIRRIQTLPIGQRYLIFFLIFGGGLVFIVAIAALLYTFTLSNTSRREAVALIDSVSVAEFAILPDDDAYPASVATAPDGTVYSASYATGVVWSINSAGTVSEIAGTRDRLLSVTGITVASDGAVYIAGYVMGEDDDSRSAILRYDGALTEIGTLNSPDELNTIFPLLDDITVDSAGNVYVSDRARREVWQITSEGNIFSWWSVPEDDEFVDDVVPTGLVYDSLTDTILITDSEANTIYRVQLDGRATEIIYRYEGEAGNAPSLDGITIAPDGTIYVAALAENGIGIIENGAMNYIVGLFRGSSDVDYDDGYLYVSNFDSRSLVDPIRSSQLPFAIDVIDLTLAGE